MGCYMEGKETRFNHAIQNQDLDIVHNVWCEALDDFLHTLLPSEATKHMQHKYTRGLVQTLRELAITNKFDTKVETLKMYLDRTLGKVLNKTRHITALYRSWRKGKNEDDEDHCKFWEDNPDANSLWTSVKAYVSEKLITSATDCEGDNINGKDDVSHDDIWCDSPPMSSCKKRMEYSPRRRMRTPIRASRTAGEHLKIN